MPFVLYAAPNFTENAVRFIDAFLRLEGVTFGLISQEPLEWLPPELSRRVAAYWRLENVFDAGQVADATRQLSAQYGSPHRILGAVEQLQVPLAEVRHQLKIPGMDVETALNFRDKARMKGLLRQAGLPCARYRTVRRLEDARTFAAETGYPLIAKPLAGAGSQTTYRIAHAAELEQVLTTMNPGPGREVLLEEFITGTEHSFDTFSLNGRPVFHSLTHYYPNPLEVVREPWIQWQVVLPREVDDPQYDDIRQYAFRTLEVLGMQTGMSHLEWFRRADGSIAISEVAARPPGAQIPTLISRAHDFDAVRAWVRLMVLGTFEAPPRRYAAGAAYLRGQGRGRVVAVKGVERIQRDLGDLLTDVRLPKIGQEASTSYEGEGFIIVRHPDTEMVRQALKQIVSTVRVELG